MATPLKAGSATGLQPDTLAGRMDEEFVALWASLKDVDLPTDAATVQDRRMIFVAVARGLLRYLHDHRADVETTAETTAGGTTTHEHQLEFRWE